jgi:hypothetical protein
MSIPRPLLVQSGSQNTTATGIASAIIDIVRARGGTGCVRECIGMSDHREEFQWQPVQPKINSAPPITMM